MQLQMDPKKEKKIRQKFSLFEPSTSFDLSSHKRTQPQKQKKILCYVNDATKNWTLEGKNQILQGGQKCPPHPQKKSDIIYVNLGFFIDT